MRFEREMNKNCCFQKQNKSFGKSQKRLKNSLEYGNGAIKICDSGRRHKNLRIFYVQGALKYLEAHFL